MSLELSKSSENRDLVEIMWFQLREKRVIYTETLWNDMPEEVVPCNDVEVKYFQWYWIANSFTLKLIWSPGNIIT